MDKDKLKKILFPKLKTFARGLMFGLVIVYAFIVFFFMVSMLGGFSKKYSRPDDCPKGHLSEVQACKGFAQSGWQSSGEYYFIAKGTPKSEIANDFLNNVHLIDSSVVKRCDKKGGRDGRDEEVCKDWEWKQVDCSQYGMTDWICYVNDRSSGNGNAYYDFLVAFSNDHQDGIFFSGSGNMPRDFVEEIQDLASR